MSRGAFAGDASPAGNDPHFDVPHRVMLPVSRREDGPMDEGGSRDEAVVQLDGLTPDRSPEVSGLFGDFPGHVENLEIVDQRPRLFLLAGSDAREDLRHRDCGTEDPRPVQQRREEILRLPSPPQEMIRMSVSTRVFFVIAFPSGSIDATVGCKNRSLSPDRDDPSPSMPRNSHRSPWPGATASTPSAGLR